MTSAALSHWFYAALTLKHKADGTSIVCNLINRPPFGESTPGTYWPILKAATGLGGTMGNILPQRQGGRLVVDNSPNSFGFERRFSDLLERYTPIGQIVEVYSAMMPVGVTSGASGSNPYSSWALAASAIVSSYEWREGADELSLNMDGQFIDRRVCVRAVDALANDFGTAVPSRNIGKFLPVIFGEDVEVPAIQTTPDGGTGPTYHYATIFDTSFINGGIQAIYAKDSDGRYYQTLSASNVSTAVLSQETESLSSEMRHNTGGALSNYRIEYAFKVNQNFSTTPYIITQIEVCFDAVGAAATLGTGEVIFRAYDHDPARSAPGAQLASSRRSASDFLSGHQAAAGTNYWIAFQLDKPLFLRAGRDVWLSLTHVSNQAVTIDFSSYIKMCAKSTGGDYAQREFGDGAGGYPAEWVPSLGTVPYELNYRFYGVKFTDVPGGSGGAYLAADGLLSSYATLSQKTAVSGFSQLDLTRFDYVFGVDGLKDDGGGTITGSAGALITSPQHAVEVLQKRWNGSAWTGGNFDFNGHSATHAAVNTTSHPYYRKINGRTTGRALVSDVIAEICADSACRVTIQNSASGALAFWAWGTEQTSVATFTDEDTEVEKVEGRGVETIINRLTMYFDERIKDADLFQGNGAGQFKQYAQQINWSSATNWLTSALATMSKALFGDRYLATPEFRWLAHESSAINVAQYLMRVFALPHSYVTFVAPWSKFNAVELLDVVSVIHPAMAAYFGTSPSSRRPTFNGSEVDAAQGHYYKRANAYRVHIESKSFELSNSALPRIRFVGRILDNYPTDPT